jgi:hypothetical protein
MSFETSADAAPYILHPLRSTNMAEQLAQYQLPAPIHPQDQFANISAGLHNRLSLQPHGAKHPMPSSLLSIELRLLHVAFIALGVHPSFRYYLKGLQRAGRSELCALIARPPAAGCLASSVLNAHQCLEEKSDKSV